MLSTHKAVAGRAARRWLEPIASGSGRRSVSSTSVCRLPRQLPTPTYEQRARAQQATPSVSNVTEELSGTDPAIPWFLQSETVDVPTQLQSISTPDAGSHFSYIPESTGTDVPETIASLQDYIVIGPSANLIARPESDADSLTPITVIHPASLTKDPSGDMYGENDWIMVVQVRSSAAGSVRRVALDIGKFLKHARPPAMGPPTLEAEDFLGPTPTPKLKEDKPPTPALPPRPKGVSRIEHELGKSLPSWAVNRIALQRKFPEGWRPPKILSREAQEGMRLLHSTNPEEFNIEMLSSRFRISPESVRRILKRGSWAVTGEARSRQDRRAAEYANQRQSSELAELRKMEQHGNELAADDESPEIEAELSAEEMSEKEEAAFLAEVKQEESVEGIVPVRYEGLVMTAADISSTGATSKSKTGGKRGDGNWCLVDADWCVVHVMTHQARYNYDIEGMWREFQVNSQLPSESALDYSTPLVAAAPQKARSRAGRDVFGQDIAKKNRIANETLRSEQQARFAEKRFGDSAKERSASKASAFSGRRSYATSAVSSPSHAIPETLNQLLSRSSTSDDHVTVKAWIRSMRKQKSFTFLEVSDGSFNGSRTLQALLRHSSKDPTATVFKADELAGLNVGSAVQLTGQLRPGPGTKAGQSIELHVSSLSVLSPCDVAYPLTAATMLQDAAPALVEESSAKKYIGSLAERRNPHLLGRLPRYAALMRTRDRIEQAMASYLASNDFVKIACPVITSTDCEGAGEVFQLGADHDVQTGEALSSFWSTSPAYLTVSSQLHLEAAGLGLARVWTLNPAFRAEASNTSRHLAEFWMLEAEMYFSELDGAMDLAEGCIRAAVHSALTRGADDMQVLTIQDATHIDTLKSLLSADKWARITYRRAHELLRDAYNAGHAFTTKPRYHTGLSSEHEKYLADVVFKAPVFVTHYPRLQKAFYMKRNSDNDTLVDCFDLLVPGIGEVVGGSAREYSTTTDMGEKLQWYTHDLKTYGGAVPHAGFGLGVERLTAYITHTENVRDVVPFPRTKGRVRF